ncbi:Adenosine deaminase related growth factor [Operophtera brumata]|uniref:Adenosine deaminase n=1 Tax=Operophtera brumata TaxID=104452 RepID=A0A0L7LPB2_OPEBR|nr:Adenosine deaminase related growth factor [Operophtera brumata]
MKAYTIAIALCLIGTHAIYLPDKTYEKDRKGIIDKEIKESLGGSLPLDKNELGANEILMKFKHKEVDELFKNPQMEDILGGAKKSQVYEIIKRMPKGAALHIHSGYMLDADTMIALTHKHEENLYACYPNDTDLNFQYSNAIPKEPCLGSKWTLLSKLRSTSRDTKKFDAKLKRHFYIDAGQKENINDVWKRFDKVNKVIKPLINFEPVRRDYFYNSLEKFYKDNIRYVEIRGGLNKLYNLDGSKHEKMYMAKLYKDIAEQFIKNHPDFMGFKFILTANRAASNKDVLEAIDLAKNLKRKMPEIFAGFDLVGQEDLGHPLNVFLPELAEARKDKIDFYFHGGETNWFGTPSDENLVDAILLGTKRIGHGYALLKHPKLLKMVKETPIPIEVNVMSNSILSLVDDVRNHPLASYLAMGMPVVLSSDDPSAFGIDPLSHDFYVAFISVASRHYDLRLLKTLALNSIKYSALDKRGKDKMNRNFEDDWKKFINELIKTQGWTVLPGTHTHH